MISEMKRKLFNDPSGIVSILEDYSFCHIKINDKEIRFARDYDGGPNIVIRLTNNDALIVVDYPRALRCDLIAYLIKTKGCTFKEIIAKMRAVTGMTGVYKPVQTREIFGGIYKNVHKRTKPQIETYPDSLLERYFPYGNQMFLDDGISLETQRKFNICFNRQENCVIIPIYDPIGNLMGCKARVNQKDAGKGKYYYDVPCLMSQTLYGFSVNYEHLCENDVFVFESEKSVMLSYTYGYKNCVALGSDSISDVQAKLLSSLCPKRIILMLDYGLDLDITKRNLDLIQRVCAGRNLDLWYWDWEYNEWMSNKDAPVDRGVDCFRQVIASELVKYEVRLEDR